jgi:hypothetical protein
MGADMQWTEYACLDISEDRENCRLEGYKSLPGTS